MRVPALDVMHLLRKDGAQVTYSDPYVSEFAVDGPNLAAEEPESAVAAADCVVIITGHDTFGYRARIERAKLVLDTRNALEGFASEKIVRL